MKNKTILYFLIVLVVVVVLVFITINKKEEPATPVVGTEQQNMPNTQQIEGVKITILKEGTGDVAKSGDTVAMNYTGKLADGTVFDSNVDPKFGHVQPFIFTLGAGQVIKGWDVGVAGMKVGEKRILEINPNYAYGATGAGGVIPPNATLSFEVELLGIKK
ncbi:MAG: FKBP-type peptidyl-prolyl cis-trans isomerase [Candidatus Nomurabacteria bacterium]|nr:FKBP-type peptidyl-prolyl cis-trans isomerase [Candidatus Nomurabacteria bacterium]